MWKIEQNQMLAELVFDSTPYGRLKESTLYWTDRDSPYEWRNTKAGRLLVDTFLQINLKSLFQPPLLWEQLVKQQQRLNQRKQVI